jgi:hypothetical protein
VAAPVEDDVSIHVSFIGVKANEPMPYLPESWLDPRLEIRESQVEGKGMFAMEPIEAGEVIVVWGGKVFTREEVEAGLAQGTVWIGEDAFLGADAGHPGDDPADYMNHSCDSNIWMIDEVTLIARRAIPSQEEVTIDYALFEGYEDFVMSWECRCGSPLCRKRITGRDWRSQELQERYAGHFSPFINERIRLLGAHK